NKTRQHVMHDLASSQGTGPHFDRSHPAWSGQWHIGHRPPPHILCLCRHRVVFGFEHEIWRAEPFGEYPLVVIGPLYGRWPVLQVSERRAGINPPDDGGDLRISQRPVVLKMLDAYRLV